MKVVFFGTPEFAAEILSFLVVSGINIVCVVTREDKPKGRGLTLEATPVKKVAQDLLPHIPILQPKKASTPEFIEQLKDFKADLFLVVAYGQILKQELLDVPPLGCINVHTSLLPKFRGAAPIQRAIIEGEAVTGSTIMKMSLEMDAGDILKQTEVPISINMTFGELRDELCRVSKDSLLSVLKEYSKITPIRQDSKLVTFAPKVEFEDCKIDWNQKALNIHNLIRGVNPEPGAWCEVKIKDEVKKLKVFSTRIVENSGLPGEILSYGKKGLVIACGEGALQLIDLQLEGKKCMSAEAFSCGISQSNIIFTFS